MLGRYLLSAYALSGILARATVTERLSPLSPGNSENA
jgi:hypothetical protein